MKSLVVCFALVALPTTAWSQTQPNNWPVQPSQANPPGAQLPPPPPQQNNLVLTEPTVRLPLRNSYNLVYGPEPLSSGARLTLVIGQGINGAMLGLSVAMIANPNSSSVYSGAMLLGAGVGVVAAMLATRDGITEGQEAAVNRGSLFGGISALYLMLSINSRLSESAAGGILATGLTLGTVGGILAAVNKPLAGRVEFASSIGIWAAFLAGHTFLLTNGFGTFGGSGRESARALGVSSLVLMGGGIVAGALLAPSVPISAARMRWINLAGLGGWLVVGLSASLFASDGRSDEVRVPYALGSLIGASAGIVLGALFTSDADNGWQQRAHTTSRNRIALMPGGTMDAPLGLSLAGTF
jgi:hypothetical protein